MDQPMEHSPSASAQVADNAEANNDAELKSESVAQHENVPAEPITESAVGDSANNQVGDANAQAVKKDVSYFDEIIYSSLFLGRVWIANCSSIHPDTSILGSDCCPNSFVGIGSFG